MPLSVFIEPLPISINSSVSQVTALSHALTIYSVETSREGRHSLKSRCLP